MGSGPVTSYVIHRPVSTHIYAQKYFASLLLSLRCCHASRQHTTQCRVPRFYHTLRTSACERSQSTPTRNVGVDAATHLHASCTCGTAVSAKPCAAGLILSGASLDGSVGTETYRPSELLSVKVPSSSSVSVHYVRICARGVSPRVKGAQNPERELCVP